MLPADHCMPCLPSGKLFATHAPRCKLKSAVAIALVGKEWMYFLSNTLRFNHAIRLIDCVQIKSEKQGPGDCQGRPHISTSSARGNPLQ